MSTMNEAVEHVLATREVAEKVAAAREEQREADIAALPFLIVEAGDPVTKSHVAAAILDEAEARIRATPLTLTPLADTIKDLQADLVNAARVAEQLTVERDAAQATAVANRHLLDEALALAKTLTEERDEAAERFRPWREVADTQDTNVFLVVRGKVRHQFTSERYAAMAAAEAELAKVTEERDAARGEVHLRGWDLVAAREEVERVSSVLDAATTRLQQADAHLEAVRDQAAEAFDAAAAAYTAIQDELNATRTAHAAAVAVAEWDGLKAALTKPEEAWVRFEEVLRQNLDNKYGRVEMFDLADILRARAAALEVKPKGHPRHRCGPGTTCLQCAAPEGAP